MSDLLIPGQGLKVPDAISPQVAEDPLLMATALADELRTAGTEVQTGRLAWREIGTRALLLGASNHEYVIETAQEGHGRVTRLNELPLKARRIGPYTMLPIERCEIKLDEVIALQQRISFVGLCRATGRFDQNQRFEPGAVTSLRYVI